MNLGKTVVSKEKAKRRQDEDVNTNVYFISLVASSKIGTPEKTRYIFDVLTEWFDFKKSESNSPAPIPVDVKYLKRFYEHNRAENDPEDPDVYYMAIFFVKQNPNSSFIFDEVPIFFNEFGIVII